MQESSAPASPTRPRAPGWGRDMIDRHSISPIHLLTCGLKAWLGFPLSPFWPPSGSLPREMWLYKPPPPPPLPNKKSCRPLAPGTRGSSCGFPALPWPMGQERKSREVGLGRGLRQTGFLACGLLTQTLSHGLAWGHVFWGLTLPLPRAFRYPPPAAGHSAQLSASGLPCPSASLNSPAREGGVYGGTHPRKQLPGFSSETGPRGFT